MEMKSAADINAATALAILAGRSTVSNAAACQGDIDITGYGRGDVSDINNGSNGEKTTQPATTDAGDAKKMGKVVGKKKQGDQPAASAKTKTGRSTSKPIARHIPQHKKGDCPQTFPEKLMLMMDYAEDLKSKSDDPDNFCISWLPDGESFLVRDPLECADKIVPVFFKKAKFSSFTRKLYRWGFHQVVRDDMPSLPTEAAIFACEHFKRDARHEIAKMNGKSNTAGPTQLNGKRKSGRNSETSDEKFSLDSTDFFDAFPGGNIEGVGSNNKVPKLEAQPSVTSNIPNAQGQSVLRLISQMNEGQNQAPDPQASLPQLPEFLKNIDPQLLKTIDPTILSTLLPGQLVSQMQAAAAHPPAGSQVAGSFLEERATSTAHNSQGQPIDVLASQIRNQSAMQARGANAAAKTGSPNSVNEQVSSSKPEAKGKSGQTSATPTQNPMMTNESITSKDGQSAFPMTQLMGQPGMLPSDTQNLQLLSSLMNQTVQSNIANGEPISGNTDSSPSAIQLVLAQQLRAPAPFGSNANTMNQMLTNLNPMNNANQNASSNESATSTATSSANRLASNSHAERLSIASINQFQPESKFEDVASSVVTKSEQSSNRGAGSPPDSSSDESNKPRLTMAENICDIIGHRPVKEQQVAQLPSSMQPTLNQTPAVPRADISALAALLNQQQSSGNAANVSDTINAILAAHKQNGAKASPMNSNIQEPVISSQSESLCGNGNLNLQPHDIADSKVSGLPNSTRAPNGIFGDFKGNGQANNVQSIHAPSDVEKLGGAAGANMCGRFAAKCDETAKCKPTEASTSPEQSTSGSVDHQGINLQALLAARITSSLQAQNANNHAGSENMHLQNLLSCMHHQSSIQGLNAPPTGNFAAHLVPQQQGAGALASSNVESFQQHHSLGGRSILQPGLTNGTVNAASEQLKQELFNRLVAENQRASLATEMNKMNHAAQQKMLLNMSSAAAQSATSACGGQAMQAVFPPNLAQQQTEQLIQILNANARKLEAEKAQRQEQQNQIMLNALIQQSRNTSLQSAVPPHQEHPLAGNSMNGQSNLTPDQIQLLLHQSLHNQKNRFM